MSRRGGGVTIEALGGLHLRLAAADEQRRIDDRRASVRAILRRYEAGVLDAPEVRLLISTLGLDDAARSLSSGRHGLAPEGIRNEDGV